MTHTVRLPKGWATAELGAILEDVRNGSTATQSKESGGIPVSRIETISSSTIDLNRVRYVHNPSPEIIERFALRNGDILFSHINSDTHLGKTGLVTEGVLPLLHGMNLLRLRTYPHVYEAALLHYLCDHYRHTGLFIDVAQHAVNQSSINQKVLKSISIPIAPFPEQHRIVEAIESYLTRLDDAVASLERVQRNLNRYRASVLKAAVEGRLVATEAELARKESRSYEPASELLKRILAERKTRWIEDAAEKARDKAEARALKAGKPWAPEDDATALQKGRVTAEAKYKEPEAPDTTDLPELPEGWCWTTIDQQYEVKYGLSEPLKKRERTSSEDIPVIRIPNVTVKGTLALEDLKYFPVPEKDRCKLLLRRGDILFNWRNSPQHIGRTAIFDVSGDYVNASFLLRIRPYAPPLDGQFAWAALNHLRLIGHFEMLSRAAVNQSNFNASETKAVSFSLPPLPEQRRILRRVDEVWSRIDFEERVTEQAIARSQLLRQSILKWAFEGKLIGQDPKDEPVSALLERIRTKRAASEQDKPKSRRKKGTTT